MAQRLPGLKWTRPMAHVAAGTVGGLFDIRVTKHFCSHRLTVSLPRWRGYVQSPAHAAKTIRRKLAKFRDLFAQALAVATEGGA